MQNMIEEKDKNTEGIPAFPRRTYKVTLACPLSDEVLVAKGKELTDTLDKIDLLTDEKKSKAKEFDARINLLEESQHRLRAIMANGSEQRPVEVYESTDFERGIVQVFRTDTDEAVDSLERRATQHELQPNLLDDLSQVVDPQEWEGEEAYVAGQPADSNPYYADQEPDKRNRWMVGWSRGEDKAKAAADAAAETEETEAEKQGREAFAEGKEKNESPYFEGDQELHALWLKGFEKAEAAGADEPETSSAVDFDGHQGTEFESDKAAE